MEILVCLLPVLQNSHSIRVFSSLDILKYKKYKLCVSNIVYCLVNEKKINMQK